MSKPVNHFYEFGEFRIDVTERLLFQQGTPVPLPPKAFDILLALVQHSGHVLEKRELIETVWPNTFIEENNLTQYISALRRALGDDRHEQHYIETVARRGYRFIAPVSEVRGEARDLIVENRTRVHVIVKQEKEEREEEIILHTPEAVIPTSARRLVLTAPSKYALAGLLAVATVAAVYWIATRNRSSQPNVFAKTPISSVAVLPFRAAGAGDADQYLGLAVAEDLTTQLQSTIRVTSASAIYKYVGTEPDAVKSGRELGVDAVVFGQWQRSGRRIAVNAQLVKTSDGSVLWKEGLEDDISNFFALQDAIAGRVTHVLFPQARADQTSPVATRGTSNADAYESHEKGRFFLNKRTSEAIHLSRGFFEQAITEDANYARAYADLADAYAFDVENWKNAEAKATRALEIDKNLGEAHATIGFVRVFWMWDWDAAERELKLAIQLSPKYATAHQWYAIYLAARGRTLDAKEEMRRALELDPFSAPINADMGQMFYFSQEYDRAIDQCLKAIAMDPEFLNAHIYLYEAYTERGMYNEAFAEYFKIQKLDGGNLLYSPAADESLRKGYAESGIKGFWKARLSFLEKRSKDDLALAEYCARLGDNDRALKLLTRAYQEHSAGLTFINVNPVFSALHKDPRFERIARQVFPQAN